MAEDTTSYELTYFPMPGRAGAARAMLNYKEIAFTNTTVVFDDWKTVKPTTTWGNLPFLTVTTGDEEAVITQSRSVLRYVGKVCGYYPEDFALAAHCDALHDVFEDFAGVCKKLQEGSTDSKEDTRKADVALGDESQILQFYRKIDNFLGLHMGKDENGVVRAVGNSLTTGDFIVYQFVSNQFGGMYDGLEMQMLRDANMDNVLAVYDAMAAMGLKMK
jgi:glutathione S-transferase